MRHGLGMWNGGHPNAGKKVKLTAHFQYLLRKATSALKSQFTHFCSRLFSVKFLPGQGINGIGQMKRKDRLKPSRSLRSFERSIASRLLWIPYKMIMGIALKAPRALERGGLDERHQGT